MNSNSSLESISSVSTSAPTSMSRSLFSAAEDVSKEVTIDDKLAKARLNYVVEKRPAYGPDASGSLKLVPNQFHIYRNDTDTVISPGTLTSRYMLLQNEDAFGWLGDSSLIGKVEVVRAGAFQGGALAFLLGKYPSVDQLPDGSCLEHFVLLTNGHVGNKKLTARPVNYAKKSGTQALMGSFGKSNKLERGIRHTKNMTVKLADGLAAIDYFEGLNRKFVSMANKMYNKDCEEATAAKFFKEEFGDPDGITEESRGESNRKTRIVNRLDKLLAAYTAAGGSNWWHVYMACCSFISNDRPTRVAVSVNSSSTKDAARLESNWYGEGRNLLDKALFDIMGVVNDDET